VPPRTRTYLVVALAAAATVALVVATVAFTRTSSGGGSPHAQVLRPSGLPKLLLDLGVRVDAEARALRRASRLYDANRPAAAARIFRGYHSVQAQVGAAFAGWPGGTLAKLQRLAAVSPRDGFVQLQLGLARFWRGDLAGAERAWRAALARDPNSASALHAEDLLHSNLPAGRPEFVPSFPFPAGLSRLSPPRQFAALAAAGRKGGARARILYGIALQRLGKPLSAEREFAAAAAHAPGDPEALVAAAVGRFTKSDPSRAFSRLGPLARRFPRSQTVRFHLGLLLLYIRDVSAARVEFLLARRDGPQTVLGTTANALLERLRGIRTG
jgi:Flp pilus assembly protein TadD